MESSNTMPVTWSSSPITIPPIWSSQNPVAALPPGSCLEKSKKNTQPNEKHTSPHNVQHHQKFNDIRSWMWNKRHLHVRPTQMPHPPCHNLTWSFTTTNKRYHVHRQLYIKRHLYWFNEPKSFKSIQYVLILDVQPHPPRIVQPNMAQGKNKHGRLLQEAPPSMAPK